MFRVLCMYLGIALVYTTEIGARITLELTALTKFDSSGSRKTDLTNIQLFLSHTDVGFCKTKVSVQKRLFLFYFCNRLI